MGYHRAGFDEIVGIDINPQTRFPFTFIQDDALEYCRKYGQTFDAIHASPPCQVHSVLSHLARKTHKDMIPATRALLLKTGKPYIMENVPGAPLLKPIMLCGTLFGLITECGAQLRRHRLFETSFDIFPVPQCAHSGRTIGIFGDKARDTAAEKRHYSKARDGRAKPQGIKFTLNDARRAMGIDWMNFKGLSQAIPPAYTEFIGRFLLASLSS